MLTRQIIDTVVSAALVEDAPVGRPDVASC